MLEFTEEQAHSLLAAPKAIRNISILTSDSKQKSAMEERLQKQAHFYSNLAKHTCRYCDPRMACDSIPYLRNPACLILHHRLDPPSQGQNDSHIIYLYRFSSLLSAHENRNHFKVIDGVIVAVGCTDSIPAQTECLLRQALSEKIKPVLLVNGIERNILEYQQDGEFIYQTIARQVDAINMLVSSYEDPDMGDLRMCPVKGNVAFGLESLGCGFTLKTFAGIYAAKFNMDDNEAMRVLWGDNYFDPDTNKWTVQSTNEKGVSLQRGFVQFIIEPIINLSKFIMNGNEEEMDKMLCTLDIKLSTEERERKGKRLLETVFSKWLNFSKSVLEMVVIHLPSPKAAQRYRASHLYGESENDLCAKAIKECDPKGPLVIYVSDLVVSTSASYEFDFDSENFFAFGRVFSGTVSAGKKVRIMNSTYTPSRKENIFITDLRSILIASSQCLSNVDSISCGNPVYLGQISRYLLRNDVISDSDEAHPFITPFPASSPLLQVYLEPTNSRDLPKFRQAIQRLSKIEPLAVTGIEHTGRHYLRSYNELHLKQFVTQLENIYARCDITTTELSVTYNETISTMSRLCMAKSANRHNRLYCVAQPISAEVAETIERKKIDLVADSQKIVEEFGWDIQSPERIWVFGSDNGAPNVLVNATKEVQFVNEMQESCISAFQWACQEGVLCEENVRQFRVDIVDACLHSDAIHRGGGQIIPTARRAYYACQLTADPRIQEPIYLINITTHKNGISGVYECLSKREAKVIEEIAMKKSPLSLIKCYLPVRKSFGLDDELQSLTKGNAWADYGPDHWGVTEGDLMDMSSETFKVVDKLRRQKGLRQELPKIKDFMDNL